jgi:hypothetical protein
LRQLTPHFLGDELPKDTVNALTGLRASLLQPQWDGAGTIPIVDGLPFFGQLPRVDAANGRRGKTSV